MPFDDTNDPRGDCCPRCDGYGLTSRCKTLPDGSEVIASYPCVCKAGDQFRRKQ